MKWILLFFGLLFVGFVNAVEIGDACSGRGFNHTESVWAYNAEWYDIEGTVDVVGNARKVNWTSPVYIDGAVYKSGNRTYLTDGGYNGTIPKTILSNDFQWIVFCTNTPEMIVPEFSMLGMIIVLGVCIGYIYRKR